MNYKKRTEEQTSNRVLTVFALGALLLFINYYLFKFTDIPTNYRTAHTLTLILFILCVLGAVGFFIKYLVLKKNGTYSNEKLSDPLFIAPMFLAASVCFAFMYANYFLAMKFIYIFIPALVLYYLIYNVYPKSFFFLSVTHGAAALILFVLYKKSAVSYKVVCEAAAIIICAAAIIITASVSKTGVLKIKNIKIRVFDKASVPSLAFVCVLYVLTAAVITAALFLPSSIVLYLFYAMLAFLACAAIYQTIRLI